MILGRTAERERLGRLVADARAGAGGVLVLRGEPGIGKTALLEDARAAAPDLLTLAVRPVEPESRLAFAGLSELLRPLLGALDDLPQPLSAALRAALALGPPVVADRFAAYTATLELLAAAARRSPVLVLVDDAHWLDRASAEALAFVARRIERERIAIVAAERAGEVDAFAGARLEELRLAGLDAPGAAELLARSSPGALAPPVTRRLLEGCAGNPLALTELPAVLTEAQRRGEAPLADPLPAGGEVTAAFRLRLDRLPPATARALAAAAAGAGPERARLGPALATLGLGLDDLAPAERAGLVALADDRLAFRHPLLRSVALELTPAPERRELHRAIARSLPEREGERRAWHLAAAAVGPDESAAAALEAAAAAAAARTGYAAAADALRRAAALTADPERRARRLLGAAVAALMAGTPESAAAALDEAAGLPVGLATRAQITRARGTTLLVTGPVDQAYRFLMAEAARLAPAAPATAADMFVDASFSRGMAGRCQESLAAARQAAMLARRGDPATRRRAEVMLRSALALTGDARRLRDLVDGPGEDPILDPVSPDGIVLAIEVMPYAWMKRFEEAERRVGALVEAARAAGAAGVLGFPLSGAGRAERPHQPFRGGAGGGGGGRAAAGGDRPARAARPRPVHAGVRRRGPGRRGELSRTRRARPRPGRADGHPLGRHLRRMRARPAGARSEPTRGGGRRARAPGGAGRLERASRPVRRPLAPELRRGARADRPDARGVGPARGARRGGWRLGQRLGLGGDLPLPRPAGRRRPRAPLPPRLGRRRAAREQLDAALAAFVACGAQSWATRAREELAALGLPSRRAPDTPETLTSRERQVAHQVSDGLTNREVAARLYLSEKTVERHLGAVYRKLGVRSRTELARRFPAA